jgi:CMP-2-keto-3-deoxyoctulosonic acid synthetase
MLNLFQHLAVSMGYETLKQVQGDIPVIYTQTLNRVCVQNRSVAAFVMLNLFQHLVVSMGYETLKQVQGDIPVIYTRTLNRVISVLQQILPVWIINEKEYVIIHGRKGD